MCESTAFIARGDDEELFLKDVVRITPQHQGILLVENLLGDQKEFKGSIKEIDFMGHKILLQPG
ncbi:MAG: CooT family nickel-binding protein [bacterium]